MLFPSSSCLPVPTSASSLFLVAHHLHNFRLSQSGLYGFVFDLFSLFCTLTSKWFPFNLFLIPPILITPKVFLLFHSCWCKWLFASLFNATLTFMYLVICLHLKRVKKADHLLALWPQSLLWLKSLEKMQSNCNELLQDTAMSKVWFKQDDKFFLPKACLNFEFFRYVDNGEPLHVKFDFALFSSRRMLPQHTI